MKTYTNAELNALVAEFSAEFDTLVKAEVAKAGQSLRKSDEGSDEEVPKAESAPAESAAPVESAPADAAESAPALSAPAESAPAESAPAESAPAESASAAPAGADPVEALQQAYAQLSPEELQQHFLALKQVLMAQGGGAGEAAPADPLAGGAPAVSADPALPAGGPDAAAPLAGEGSKPVDPMSTMALKSEFEKQLNLVKSQKDEEIKRLEKSLEDFADTMTKMLAQPIRKSVTGKDLTGLMKSEQPAPKFESMSKSEITKKLTAISRDPSLKKSDRELINKYCMGAVKVDALAHLLG